MLTKEENKLVDQLADAKVELLAAIPNVAAAITKLDKFAGSFGVYLTTRPERGAEEIPNSEEAKSMVERVAICSQFLASNKMKIGAEIHFPDMIVLNLPAYRRLVDSVCKGHPID